MNQFSTCIPVLRRWAAHTDRPLPESWSELVREAPSIAMRIQETDPELASLLNGTAPASLVADALQGVLSPIAPDYAAVTEQNRQQQVSTLMNGEEPNLTNLMQLALLDQQKAVQYEARYAPAPVSEAEQQAINDHIAQRAAEARAQSMQHTFAGGY